MPVILAISEANSTSSRATMTEGKRRKPRGNMFYSGVISKIEAERLWIRTRTEGLKDLRLRADTRYLDHGDAVAREKLLPGMRVYLRAGIGWDDDLEIYQVTWGEILSPRP